jgi:hypothetical protein
VTGLERQKQAFPGAFHEKNCTLATTSQGKREKHLHHAENPTNMSRANDFAISP